ncbi:MAG: protein translocase subunit SecD [Pseudomonadota bacterium]|nr:protein translocase subunit SecD [Pseudomonadota bacterium]MDE3037186.1 protein translocase subunit SecD [Pseudomonadota bacterium]
MLHFPRWKILLITGSCVLFVLLAIPSFLSESTRNDIPDWLPHRAVNLGLDLQGGSQLLLEVDFDAYMREQLTNLVDEIRVRFRAQKIGYKGLSIAGGKVIFALRGTPDAEVEKVLEGVNSDIDVTRTGEDYQVAFTDRWKKTSKSQILDQSLEIVSRRVNETGTKEPSIQRQGDNRILLQVPGLADPEHLKALLGRTAKMTFHMVDESASPEDIARGIAPPGDRIVPGDERSADKNGGTPRRYAVYSHVELSGDMLVDAHPAYDQDGSPAVAFRFNAAGARKFGEITAANVGKLFAIVLDDKVITAPVIRSPILGGSGIITGNFTAQSANDLALLLRAGALPAPLRIIEERSVGPSLGADSIAAGTKASIIGIGLVVVFMVVFYGLFGLFADVAMLVNAFMTVSLLSLFEATLTLPGIAGIVLTVGMAVDANVLIYERMREEVRNGKPPYQAIEDGFRLAFGTIFDSHVTTLVAALILFQFGTGTVKGFAVTLAIGIICSLYTAVLVTRLMVVTWLRKTRPKVLPI